jgi:hypothetical protein
MVRGLLTMKVWGLLSMTVRGLLTTTVWELLKKLGLQELLLSY